MGAIPDFETAMTIIRDLEAQVESTNNLLRDASEDMAQITEALGPQTHSGSIADAVRALVAKCERLEGSVSDEEFHKFSRTDDDGMFEFFNRGDANALIAARAGKEQP
jgi:hypothetical protein